MKSLDTNALLIVLAFGALLAWLLQGRRSRHLRRHLDQQAQAQMQHAQAHQAFQARCLELHEQTVSWQAKSAELQTKAIEVQRMQAAALTSIADTLRDAPTNAEVTGGRPVQ